MDPGKEDERKLFAHYVWNAGVLLGEAVAGRREWDVEEDGGEGGTGGFRKYDWNVGGETVLELGAGGYALALS